jgi:HEAT repeat protein
MASLRKEAAAALGEIADPSVRDALMEHVSDADPDVRKTVRWALTRLG